MRKPHLTPRVRPWQRMVAIALIAAITWTPVSARGPGRAGIDALVEEPDALPPKGANQPANFVYSLDPTLQLPGDPTIPGSQVDALGPQSAVCRRGGWWPAGYDLWYTHDLVLGRVDGTVERRYA
jgi:hypothetical protein